MHFFFLFTNLKAAILKSSTNNFIYFGGYKEKCECDRTWKRVGQLLVDVRGAAATLQSGVPTPQLLLCPTFRQLTLFYVCGG